MSQQRTIVVDGVMWAWRVGKQEVVFRNQSGESHRCDNHVVAGDGVSAVTFERGQRKKTSDGMLTPKQVARYLREYTRMRSRLRANAHMNRVSSSRGHDAVQVVADMFSQMNVLRTRGPSIQGVRAQRRPQGTGWRLDEPDTAEDDYAYWVRDLRAWGPTRPRGDGWKRKWRIDKDSTLPWEQKALLLARGKAVYCWERKRLTVRTSAAGKTR